MLLRSLIGAAISLLIFKLIHSVSYDSYAAWQYEPTGYDAKNAKILVTGSSRGIGRAVALLYCSLGAKVVMHGRSKLLMDKLASECRSLGSADAKVVIADMSDAGAAAAAVDKAAAAVGGLDAVIVNHVSPYIFETQSSLLGRVMSGEVQRALVTDLLSYAAASAAAVQHLEASKGSLILVTSLAAQMPLPYCYAYCYAKRALAGHAIALRQELAINGSSVHVGLAHLGSIDTETARRLLINQYTEPISFTSTDATARGIAAMVNGKIEDLVIPGQLKPVVLLNAVAPSLLAAKLRDIAVKK